MKNMGRYIYWKMKNLGVWNTHDVFRRPCKLQGTIQQSLKQLKSDLTLDDESKKLWKAVEERSV